MELVGDAMGAPFVGRIVGLGLDAGEGRFEML
jgi:hypothetical protein